MHLIYVDSEGPVAATYTEQLAERAVLSLRAAKPGKRIWRRQAPVEDVERYKVEVLLTPADTRVCDQWEVRLKDGKLEAKQREQTLAGLAMRGGHVTGEIVWGFGRNRGEAEQFLWKAKKEGPQEPTIPFRLEDLVI